MAKKRVTRSYDSKSRDDLAEQNKVKVIAAAIKLLKKDGSSFSLRKLAKSASCSERHLYRMFGGLEGLSKELNNKINELIGFSMDLENIKIQELPQQVRSLFQMFNANEELVSSYISSPIGVISRKLWFDEKNQKLKNSLKKSGATEILAKEISVLLSASFWKIVRFESDMSQEESIDFAGSLAELILEKAIKKEGL